MRCSAPRLTALSLLLAAGAACAQTEQLKMSLEMRLDPAHIDRGGGGRERLGLVTTSLLFEPAYDWWVGPAVVGAATGQRGGFFVLGGQVARRWRSTDNWVAQLGLLMGGGGGGGAPVGGGLMLMPSASLSYDWGGVQTGLSVSSVNMPSGRISSRQIGLVINWDGRFRYFDAGEVGRKLSTEEHTGLGFDRLMLGSSPLHVKARQSVPASTVRLVGARAERRLGPNVYWGVETAAATHGGADGYMEILGTSGWETSASAIGLSDLYLGARVAWGWAAAARWQPAAARWARRPGCCAGNWGAMRLWVSKPAPCAPAAACTRRVTRSGKWACSWTIPVRPRTCPWSAWRGPPACSTC